MASQKKLEVFSAETGHIIDGKNKMEQQKKLVSNSKQSDILLNVFFLYMWVGRTDS